MAYNTTLQKFIEDEFDINIIETSQSGFIDPVFERLSGSVSSAMSIYDSYVDLLARVVAERINFKYNIAMDGTTIYSTGSVMNFVNITMLGNYANEGGCLHFVSSRIKIEKSFFGRNVANQGGVFFAI